MFVLNKKRIYIILFCLLLSTLAFKANDNKLEVIETVALPVNNKVIVIDARAWSEKIGGASSDERCRRSRH